MQLHSGTSITDWAYYQKQARAMTDDQLRYVIEDCRQAMEVAPAEANYPCKASGFYADEMHTYYDELRKRKKK